MQKDSPCRRDSGARSRAPISASRCARCALPGCRFASQSLICYLCGQEGDAERAHGSWPGRLAQTPRRLEVVAGGGSPDHRECEGIFLWYRLQAGALSHPTQVPAGARLRAFACPDGHLRPLEGPGGCGASECHLHTRCNPDVSSLSAPPVGGLHTVNANRIRGCVRTAYSRDAITTGVKSLPDASPSMRQPAFSPSGFPSEPLRVAGDEPAVARTRDEVEPVPAPLPAPCRGCSRPRTSLYRRCERADGARGLWTERWWAQSEGAFCSSASTARVERISSSTSSPRPFPIISFRNARARMCVYRKIRSRCRAGPRSVPATAGSVPTAVKAAEELPTNGGCRAGLGRSRSTRRGGWPGTIPARSPRASLVADLPPRRKRIRCLDVASIATHHRERRDRLRHRKRPAGVGVLRHPRSHSRVRSAAQASCASRGRHTAAPLDPAERRKVEECAAELIADLRTVRSQTPKLFPGVHDNFVKDCADQTARRLQKASNRLLRMAGQAGSFTEPRLPG